MEITKIDRKFIDNKLKINSFSDIEKYFIVLEKENIKSVKGLEKWIQNRSELEAFLEEDMAWRYIKMSCDTNNEELKNSFHFFISEIEPKVSIYVNKLNEKLEKCSFLNKLDQKKYFVFLRNLKREIELFREENIPIFTEMQKLEQKYGEITGNMMVEENGKEITLQQASIFLKNNDRKLREKIYKKIINRKLTDSNELNLLLSDLVEKRNKIALNAGFKNYRDYKFSALKRFDYKVKDCYDFHDSIAEEIKPLINELHKKRKQKLGYKEIKPWDLEVNINSDKELKPFIDGKDLLKKGIKCLTSIKPFYGDVLKTMQKIGHLDLDSRKGKAPGGFNYPLHESGIPFIFMNAAGSLRDVETLCHEAGHAIHSVLTKDLEITEFKETTSEVAELASMSMELISMDGWDKFFENKEELRQAKIEQIEGIIKILPWIAIIDKFQHWLYLNPKHTIEEREKEWVKISKEIGNDVVDWKDLEHYLKISWQSQLHIFEVPFYYIEYGIAQLGAIAIWKNYKQKPEEALIKYENALKLGNTKSIPEIYEAAGIKFDFSKKYIKELAMFLKEQLEKLY